MEKIFKEAAATADKIIDNLQARRGIDFSDIDSDVMTKIRDEMIATVLAFSDKVK